MAGKKKGKPHKKVKKTDYYKVDGEKIERTRKFCPKCGEGVFMGEHKRGKEIVLVCGKCGYSEVKK